MTQTPKATDMELVAALRAEAGPERREEILSKGWDVPAAMLRKGAHGDYPRMIFESWMLDGKDELLLDAASRLLALVGHLEGRDAFIVKHGLWEEFVRSLPTDGNNV